MSVASHTPKDVIENKYSTVPAINSAIEPLIGICSHTITTSRHEIDHHTQRLPELHAAAALTIPTAGDQFHITLNVQRYTKLCDAADQLQAIQRAVLAMPVARTLQLAFRHMAEGEVQVEIPIAPELTFRPGQLQATAIFAVADFAAVSAAATLLPLGASNATIDTTLKIFAPAVGTHLRGKGRVISHAKLLSVCAADVLAVDEHGAETLCATLLATARNILPR